MYGHGVSHESELIDLAVEADIIDKSGAWYSYNGNKIGQGKENSKLFLKNNPNILMEIEDKVREVYDISLKKDKKQAKKEDKK